jgi:hypothetical protein
VFNTIFSNISAISWQPVLVVEEAGEPGENHRPWASKNRNIYIHVQNFNVTTWEFSIWEKNILFFFFFFIQISNIYKLACCYIKVLYMYINISISIHRNIFFCLLISGV